jgi:hypothetical protein
VRCQTVDGDGLCACVNANTCPDVQLDELSQGKQHEKQQVPLGAMRIIEAQQLSHNTAAPLSRAAAAAACYQFKAARGWRKPDEAPLQHPSPAPPLTALTAAPQPA